MDEVITQIVFDCAPRLTAGLRLTPGPEQTADHR